MTSVWARAKAELRRRGWYQGDYGALYCADRTRNAAVCLLGAVNAAVTGDPNSDEWPDASCFYRRIFQELATRGEGIEAVESPSRWNDDPERTIDEVYGLLDRLDAEDQAVS